MLRCSTALCLVLNQNPSFLESPLTNFLRRNMAHEGYHEPLEQLSETTRDMHRAISSLMEELEAVDWYAQRVDACKDDELRAILAHNMNEEKEHAAMVLEWLRRRDPVLNKHLRDYLFTDKSIVALEDEHKN